MTKADLSGWAKDQAQLLREMRFDERDVPNLTDEVLTLDFMPLALSSLAP
ncbi:DUF29 family protein [Methylobacterium sp. GC_Met_2]|nr:DUF29 family protein [Methylobacterium sp. GC_Met_2]